MNGQSDRLLIAGNWKANGSLAMIDAWGAEFKAPAGLDAVVFAPAPYLRHAAARIAGAAVGAQDLDDVDDGAHTGCVTARMLADLGCRWTLAGHSERRQAGESGVLAGAKLARAAAAGVSVVLCVGESQAEREAGRLEEVLRVQLDEGLPAAWPAGVEVAIAYEPVWAIGTGLAASAADAQQAGAWIRSCLAERGVDGKIRILYGGSVKPGNAAGFVGQPDIDGLLVGGASLEPGSFSAICAGVLA